MQFNDKTQATIWFDKVFMCAARIVEGDTHKWDDRIKAYVNPYDGRAWFRRERRRHNLHGAVQDMILQHLYRPHNWHQLLLEWPHRSQTDANRIAYTRDERAGEQDRQTVTTIGKYLGRHFPDAPDHIIRDVTALYTYGGDIEIVKTVQEMVNAVRSGPGSCMSKEFNIRCDDGVRRHPYAVYDPSLGWAMAVRRDRDGDVMGRCLLWHDPDDEAIKIFVRSYKRERETYSHSGTDEAIETYLRNLGYQRHSEWPIGTPLMKYEVDGGWLMPYIDGGTQKVDSHTFTIDDDGDLDADNTDGVTRDGNATCSHCGRRYNDETEGIWIGIHEDEHVCGNCEDEYTYAYSRRGNQYYIHNDRVIYIDGEHYDADYLTDNNIVCLADGEYTHIDNAVWVESQQEYYHVDDDDICYAEDTRQYEHKSDCWQCEGSLDWYTDETDHVEIDGLCYHPDHAPETTDETDSGAAA